MSDYQVFLSYSFKDLHKAERVRIGLWYYGVSVYPDKILTPGTDEWHAKLIPVLSQVKYVVALLSPDTLGSLWVKLALDYAQSHQIPVLPMVVGGDPGHVLLVKLAGSVWFDLRRNSSYRSELDSLASLIEARQDDWARSV